MRRVRHRQRMLLQLFATTCLVLQAVSATAEPLRPGSHSYISGRLVLGVPGLVGLMATVSGTSPIVLQLGGAGRDYQAWLGWSLLVPNAPGSKWRYDWQPEPGSPEEVLYTDYLVHRDWA